MSEYLTCKNDSYTKQIYNFFYDVEYFCSIEQNIYNINSHYPSSHILPFNHFYFIKHGITDWNKHLLKYGKVNLPLNSIGQAEMLKAFHAINHLNIDVIISSPLYRTLEMSYTYSKLLNVPMIVAYDMEERNFGDWSQKQKVADVIIKDAPAGARFFQAIREQVELNLPPDAETQQEFEARIIQALNKYNDLFHDKNVIYVSHGCVRKAINEKLGIEDVGIIEEYAIPLVYNASDPALLYPLLDI